MRRTSGATVPTAARELATAPSRPDRLVATRVERLPSHAGACALRFGLLGHLVEMTEASGVGAQLALDRLPVLDGARETAAQGALSSLQPQNTPVGRAVHDAGSAQEWPLYPLLFDPQTAGGLLAGGRLR